MDISKKITPTTKAQGSMPKSGQKDCMNQRIRDFTGGCVSL